jgi:hypothetical protein
VIRRFFANRQERSLLAIKVVHTVVWAFFVACIVAIPVLARRGALVAAACCAAFVLAEVLVLALNRWSCPLTPLAARYTQERRPNFDIFLPEWLARHNKTVFGWLYGAGLVYLIASWVSRSG